MKARRIAAGAIMAACALRLATLPADPPPRPAVEEDEPGWNCHTQGNRVCGPTNQQGETAP